jgi:hypothetical protein
LDALIGDTGFVGGILACQHDFAARFNSRTIGGAAGRSFDTVVCAAAPGSMFEANRFPELDRQRIDGLIDQLGTIEAKRFILISTIAVLAGFAAENEDSRAFEEQTHYGVNRRRLEAFVEERFPGALVVRLPALFGPGLRKNFLFDIMNPMPSMLAEARLAELRSRIDPKLADGLADFYAWREDLGLHLLDRDAFDRSPLRADFEVAVEGASMAALQFTNPASQYQYYDMRRLWSDIGLALAAGVRTIHLAPAPVAAAEIYRAVTGRAMPRTEARLHAEDMRTGLAALWDRAGPYIADPSDILAGIATFARAEGRSA